MKPVKNRSISLQIGGHYWTSNNIHHMMHDLEFVVDDIKKRPNERILVYYHYPSVNDNFVREYKEVMEAVRQ
jgi:hypothetical protein